jgi:hypothetical protein
MTLPSRQGSWNFLNENKTDSNPTKKFRFAVGSENFLHLFVLMLTKEVPSDG